MAKLIPQTLLNVTGVGSATTTAWVDLDSVDAGVFSFEITLSAVGTNATFNIDLSVDASTAVAVLNQASTAVTANGLYVHTVNRGSYRYARVNFSASTGGTPLLAVKVRPIA